METVEFRDVEVLDEVVAGLLCRIAAQQVTVPSLLLQPRTAVRRAGDRGMLVIPRWLGIGLGLVWPLPEAAAGPGCDSGGDPLAGKHDPEADHGMPHASEVRKRRAPRRAARRDRAAERLADRGGDS
jgi:hypothetical protein